MKIALFGASGKTGAQVLKLALAAGHDVTALVRDPAALVGIAGVHILKGTPTDADDVDHAMVGRDVAISCVGSRTLSENTTRSETAQNLVAAAKKHGVKKIIFLSAVGVGDSAAQAKRSSRIFGYVIMPLVLKANYADAEKAENILRESGVPFVITRPVGLTDDDAKDDVVAVTDLSAKLARAYMSRADVAAWMLARAADDAYDREAVSIY